MSPRATVESAALEKLGPALRWMREQRALTLEQVAHRARINVSSLSRLEREALRPKLGTLVRILEGLEADFLDLGLALRTVRGRSCGLSLPEGLSHQEQAALALTAYGFEAFVASLSRRVEAGGRE